MENICQKDGLPTDKKNKKVTVLRDCMAKHIEGHKLPKTTQQKVYIKSVGRVKIKCMKENVKLIWIT